MSTQERLELYSDRTLIVAISNNNIILLLCYYHVIT